jgi:hypothetical protein
MVHSSKRGGSLALTLAFMSLTGLSAGCSDDLPAANLEESGEGGEDGSSDDAGPDDCSLESQRQFVFDSMYDHYLWSELIPDVVLEDYETAADLALAMRYPTLDIWTRVKDKGIANAWVMEGKFIGYGFSTRRDADDNVRLSFIDPNSPASAEGLERGWIIKSINGMTKAELDEAGTWSEAFGPSEPGVSADYVFETLAGEEVALTLTRDWIDSITVPVHGIYDTDAGPVGYLLFTKFVDDAAPELEAAFASFTDAGVERLIIDFRYNGGGSLSMTRHLNNLTLGKRVEGEVSYTLTHNPMMAEEFDRIYYFEDLAQSMDLSKIVFITTGSTKSASEAVINSLEPHTDVQLVGSQTAGKPVGTRNYEFCEQLLTPISFTIRNSVGNANYYDGMEVDCAADDDLLHAFGDAEEGMLSAALALASDAACPG